MAQHLSARIWPEIVLLIPQKTVFYIFLPNMFGSSEEFQEFKEIIDRTVKRKVYPKDSKKWRWVIAIGWLLLIIIFVVLFRMYDERKKYLYQNRSSTISN